MTLPASFFPPFVAMCGRLQVDPVDLLAVASNESGCNAAAHNPNGHASGLWQLMPSTARGLGWDVTNDPHLDAFRALGAIGQLVWWEKYFSSYRGRLVNRAACYTATFLPAFLGHADDPDYVLCGARGPLTWAYNANQGFDPTHKGTITVADLTAAIDRATRAMGNVWLGYVDCIRSNMMAPVDEPIVGLDDAPIFLTPEPPDHDPEAA